MDKPEIPSNGAPFDPVVDINAVAAYAKQGSVFRVGTAAQRAALPAAEKLDGMHWQDTDGQKREYVLVSGGWVPVGGSWVDFTPTFTGITAGTSMYARVKISDGECSVRVGVVLGGGGSWSDIHVEYPITPAAWQSNLAPLGGVVFYDQSLGINGRIAGAVYKSAAGARILALVPNGGHVLLGVATGSQPFLATSGDELHVEFSYPVI